MRTKCASNQAFTLIELLIVMGIIGTLAAILLPVYAHVREQGRRTACLSNMKQIDLALTMYTQDNSGVYPPQTTLHNDWAGALLRYAPSREVFRCPSAQVPPSLDLQIPVVPYDLVAKGYAMNSYLADASVSSSEATSDNYVRFPSTTIAVAEVGYSVGSGGNTFTYQQILQAPDLGFGAASGYTPVGPPGGLRHGGGSNYAFADGHVHWYTPVQVSGGPQASNGSRPSFAL